jgi:outer membrane protein assembly factor BamB
MSRTGNGKGVVVVVAVAAVLSLSLWISADSSFDLSERLPGEDRRNTALLAEGGNGPLTGELTLFDGEPSGLPGVWPGFRGPKGDNVCTDPFRPAPKGSPFPVCWSLDVGEGHAGAAVLAGRVYLHDYDRENEKDAIRCLSLDDGREIWRYSYPVKVKRNHGMSRCVPAVTTKFLVALGPKCHVTCLDPKSGELLWALDLVRDFGTKVPPWYAGQCPIIDRGRAIFAPCGTDLLIAVDCRTGEVLWRSPNERGWKMTHSSILPMDFAGKRFYVYCGSGGVAGVSAADGSILWETGEWRIRMATVPTPVVAGEGRIFLSGGYQAGSMMLRLREDGEKIEPEILFRLGHREFGSAQQTPVFLDGHIYGVRPDEQLVCLDIEGKEKWTSTSAHKFGLGPYAVAGSLIYVMNDEGLLSRVEARADAFRLVDERRVLEGHDSWGPFAFAGGRLILRDLTRMICIDVSEEQ